MINSLIDFIYIITLTSSFILILSLTVVAMFKYLDKKSDEEKLEDHSK